MFFVWALLFLGLILVFLEFFLPGAILAVGGGMLLLSSLFLFHLKGPEGIGPLLIYLAVLILSLYFVIRLAIWSVKKTAKKGTVYLDADQEGFQASLFPKELVGKTGTAATDLRPSGHIWVDDRAVQALSKDGYIEKGASVYILGGQGSHLIVKSEAVAKLHDSEKSMILSQIEKEKLCFSVPADGGLPEGVGEKAGAQSDLKGRCCTLKSSAIASSISEVQS